MSHFNINDFDNESNLSEEENAFGFSNISKLMQIEKVKYPNENFVNLSLDSFHASFSERKTEPSFQNINLDLKALYLQKEHERKSEPFSKSFLTKKRKRENNNNERNEEKNWEGEEQKEKAKTKRKKNSKNNKNNRNGNSYNNLGRKKKEPNNKEKAGHNKFTKDNIMRKLKTFIFQYILKLLNNSLKDKKYQFYKLHKKLHENLKKSFNEELLKTKLCDIYSNLLFQNSIKNSNNPNKKLIDQIYKEKKEKKTIKILDMKFIEILEYIRKNDLNTYLNSIRDKEIRNNNEEEIELYMNDVESLLFNYENWFYNKLGRNR